MGAVRQAIIDYAVGQGYNRVLMLDDDLRFVYRYDPENSFKFKPLPANKFDDMIKRINDVMLKPCPLDGRRVAFVGISARPGNHRRFPSITEYYERVGSAWLVDIEVMQKENFDVQDCQDYEDLNLLLQLITHGYATAVLYDYANEEPHGMNAAGGCWRSVPKNNTVKFQKIWPRLILPSWRSVQRNSKAWQGELKGERTDVILYLKKAAKSVIST